MNKIRFPAGSKDLIKSNINEILNGKKPSEIPVKFMTKPSDSDLLFDLDTAKVCGITIPEDYLKQATYIIENGKLTKKE